MSRKFLPLIFFFWLLLLPAGALAANHVVLIDLDRTTLGEWLSLHGPAWDRLLRIGSLGLMNSNTADGPSPASADLTLGTSAHAHGAGAGLAFNRGERLDGQRAGEIYRLEGGTGRGRIVNLGLGSLVTENAHLPYILHLGAIGDALHNQGMRTAVLGNADTPDPFRPRSDWYHREAVAIAMDSGGTVDLGDVGDGLLRKAPRPFGVEMANRKLLRAFEAVYPRAALTVIDYGDTARADDFRARTIGSRAATRLTREALEHFSTFLNLLLPRLDLSNTTLLILSPAPASTALQKNATLTPILAAGRGFGPGELTSPTTHRRGIVANVDVAPTILHELGVPSPTGLFGQPLRTLPAVGVPDRLLGLARLIAVNSALRLPVLKTVVYVIVLLFLTTIAYLALTHRRRPLLSEVLRYALEAELYLPLALLLLGAFRWESPAPIVAFLILFPVFGVWLGRRLFASPFSALSFPMLLTVGALVVDLLRGAPMIKFSLLGYDPQIGARYYGIGNEFMGVMIGAATIGFGLLLQRWSGRPGLRSGVILALLAIDLLMVWPGIGTKAGAAITATAAFGVMALRLSGRRVGLRQAGLLALVIILLLGLLIALDLLLHGSGHRTDIGRAALLIWHGGVYQALIIIGRKLGTNYSLLRGSYWNMILLASLVALILSVTNRLGRTRELIARYRLLAHGFAGAAVGVVVGFFFNDTGVVAASTTIIYPLTALLWLDLAPLPWE